ncbi:hypothetical protein ACN9MH_21760 [Paenibacillus silvae]|jgi:hypothetical protein|uniref:hypothetical protein n=1 Tax=Paenibacillus silvae TaxID=1325358 RepID=UPI003CF390AC
MKETLCMSIKAFFQYVWSLLVDASDVVEYVGWITASIFAIIAVFSIFLAFQFQVNVSDSGKLIGKMREVIKNRKVEDLTNVREEFISVNSKFVIVTNAVDITQRVIKFLIGIWSVSGLSVLASDSFSNVVGFNLIRFCLIASVTILFLYFVSKLSQIISDFSSTEAEKNQIHNQEDLCDIEKLIPMRVDITDIIYLSNPAFIFSTWGDEPYVEASIEQDVVFSNFNILLTIISDEAQIFIGASIKNPEKSTSIIISSVNDREKINQFLFECGFTSSDISITISTGNMLRHYMAQVEVLNEDNYKITMGTQINNSWSPPSDKLDLLRQGQGFISVHFNN